MLSAIPRKEWPICPSRRAANRRPNVARTNGRRTNTGSSNASSVGKSEPNKDGRVAEDGASRTRIDERARITDSTKRVLHLAFRSCLDV